MWTTWQILLPGWQVQLKSDAESVKKGQGNGGEVVSNIQVNLILRPAHIITALHNIFDRTNSIDQQGK